ncbi:hypothetical protein NBO_27g0044 [Nosema bombycis CQ1]|uniref:Uncharacterized protein n=1 Tax=Nosema bombycis (strain CQ1 / CVCC 102059) TaxID=578461 RepID=R0KWA2_NOSB1|nr:hypothetical protein NBO_27g0044 [Nosema bombycis CQ1]|eukprot:EOB14487.1 hypothetical protein NBO_27g0044 [Nosema bombycis CQ1]
MLKIVFCLDILNPVTYVTFSFKIFCPSSFSILSALWFAVIVSSGSKFMLKSFRKHSCALSLAKSLSSVIYEDFLFYFCFILHFFLLVTFGFTFLDLLIPLYFFNILIKSYLIQLFDTR